MGDTWYYEQTTGKLYDKDGVFIEQGYSGKGEHKNNPSSENIKNQGPIPKGVFTFGDLRDSTKTGKDILDLNPEFTTNRTAIQIHGERKTGPPGEASSGCVILSDSTRTLMAYSNYHKLTVVEKFTPTIS